MVIGTLQLELRFFDPQSLKEKRMLLKSLTDRIRRQFNVSVAEIDGMDLWQASTLAVAAVAGESKRANQILSQVVHFVGEQHGMDLMKHKLEFF